MIFHLSVVWFACSATLNKKAERLVLSHTKFQVVGICLYQTEVIKTSINHPDISIYVQLISRQKVDLWENLYFLLNNCMDSNRTLIPTCIPKTIVFINDQISVWDIVKYFQNVLLQKSKAYTRGADNNNKAFCISSVIQEFTVIIQEYDCNQ